MSIEALNWAFAVQVPSSGAKLVLLTLANYSNESGEAYPSQKAMAEKTCLSERAIRDNLVRLEEWKLISRVPRTRANGSYTTDLFRLYIGAEPVIEMSRNEAETDAETQRQNLPAAESASGEILQTQRQILPNPAADSAAPEPSLKTTIIKNNQPAREQAREALTKRSVPVELANRWIELREKKSQPIPDEATLDTVQAEAWLVGLRLEQALTVCVSHGWAWFKAKWYQDLPDEKKLCSTHGPPKALAGEGWRRSPDSVFQRGMELGIEPRIGESERDYGNRVGKADWDASRVKAAEVLGQFKGKANAGESVSA